MNEFEEKTLRGRTFTFGKYKGKFILEVIRKEQWYIEWVNENVDWFKLNDEERTYYDQTVSDFKEAWNKVRYAFKTGEGMAKEMYKTVEAYKMGLIRPLGGNSPSAHPHELSYFMDKLMDIEEDIYGSDPMCLFD